MTNETELTFIGGRYFIAGIPARDLTAAEVERYGGLDALIATGLYEPVTPSAASGAEEEE